MNVFITSSPFVENADRALLSNDNHFVDRIREALPPFPRCLYISSDPERRDLNCRWGADIFKAFAEAEIFFQQYDVLDGYNADQAPELVQASDFIVLAGGHVPTQNAFFQEIHLRELLEGYEGTVMGISAGSMNLADTVYSQPEEPGESDPEFPRWLPGLNLTDVNILPHYQKVKNNYLDGKRLYEDIAFQDSMGSFFFVLPDGSYIFQDEEHQLLCGKGWLLHDAKMTLLCRSGHVFDLSALA